MLRRFCSIILIATLVLIFNTSYVKADQRDEKIASLESQVSELLKRIRKLEGEQAETKKAISGAPSSGAGYSGPAIKMYGWIKTDFVYDNSQTNNNDATGFVISENSAKANDNQFSATAQHSRFGLDLTGPEFNEGKVGGKVEIDFLDSTSANSFKPRIRHLYTDIVFPKWSLLFGQTWDVIGPVGPDMLNTNGWLWRAGNIGFRRTQARLTNNFNLTDQENLTTQISANRNIGSTNGSLNTGDDSGQPLIEGRIGVTTTRINGKNIVLGVGGAYGREEVDRTTANRSNWKAEQWAVVGDAVVPITDKLSVKGELFTGRDLGTFLAGIGQGINTTQENSIYAHGGWGQISYQLNKLFTINSGYGMDSADKEDLNNSNAYKNQVVFANVIYSPIKSLKFGIEYSHWYTEYLNAHNGDDNKIQTSVIWSF